MGCTLAQPGECDRTIHVQLLCGIFVKLPTTRYGLAVLDRQQQILVDVWDWFSCRALVTGNASSL